VIENVVWTNSWLSIAGAGCGLTTVGAGEEQALKVVASEASRCGEAFMVCIDDSAWFLKACLSSSRFFLFGDFRSLFLAIFLERFRGRFLGDLLGYVCLKPSWFISL
jgi:hypothetical protein